VGTFFFEGTIRPRKAAGTTRLGVGVESKNALRLVRLRKVNGPDGPPRRAIRYVPRQVICDAAQENESQIFPQISDASIQHA
jgi:hypothetical protein